MIVIIAILIALLIPAGVQRVREAARRTQMQNLLQAGGGICTALHLFFEIRRVSVGPQRYPVTGVSQLTTSRSISWPRSGLPMLSL